ncbi:hypothetical protein [Bowmanella sp. JS7-9]|uniref:Uncharacterized protein n=1 Tax=Pseudobowmanella zhangzhouensis TaxID=1537679 RepID=A0ABW1XL50_9ALTE|nr:hypothetical protein [Bowmanella sp. JS7-9]
MLISHAHLLGLLLAPVATFTGAAIIASRLQNWRPRTRKFFSRPGHC